MAASYSLADLGWSDFFDEQWPASEREQLQPFKIVRADRGAYRAVSPAGEALCEVSGRFEFTALSSRDWPTVGDWVLGRSVGDGPVIVERVLERKSELTRSRPAGSGESQLLAANVDTVAIVQSCNRDFNLRRIERYVAGLATSGAELILILSKSDLIEAGDEERFAIPPEWPLPVLRCSAQTGAGLEVLRERLQRAHHLALLGSSGVGKSTLSNALAGWDALKTQAIRGDDDRGRHTTTARHMVATAAGAWLIDTPGMREFGLADADLDSSGLFDEIAMLSQDCRFRDCQHQGEPGCAVQAAIDSGQLDPGRLTSLRKLQREEEFRARQEDKALAANAKKRWKGISKQIRRLPKKTR